MKRWESLIQVLPSLSWMGVRKKMKPLEIEVISPIVNSFNHCGHCQVFIDAAGVGGKVHEDDVESFPKEFLEDYQKLSDSILGLVQRYQGRVLVRVIDPASALGLWKSLRYRVSKYPTWIVAGQDKVVGLDAGALDRSVQAHLSN
jgi:hypothetical protein